MKKKVKRGAKRLLKSLALFVEVHKVVEVVVEERGMNSLFKKS